MTRMWNSTVKETVVQSEKQQYKPLNEDLESWLCHSHMTFHIVPYFTILTIQAMSVHQVQVIDVRHETIPEFLQ